MAYTQGECTYGAWLLAQWLPTNMGNANTWVSDASKDGLSISAAPVVGAAMVFNGNYPGSDGDGHVGIVQSIGSNGYPVIKEMNAGRNGGGFGLYDTYQTTAYDTSFVEGYIVPPGSASANSTTSAQLSGDVLPQLQVPWPISIFTGGGTIANPNGVNTNPNPLGIVEAILGPALKAGEVLLGAIIVFVGLYFIAKDAGASGVTNVIGKIPGVGAIKGLA